VVATANGIVEPALKNDIMLHSSKILNKLLKMCTDKPGFIGVHADKGGESRALNRAAGLYCKAAKLFLKKGEISAAIAMKAIQWRINSPTKSEVNNFLLNMGQVPGEPTPAKLFFCLLNVPESIALYSSLEILRLPANRVVKKIGGLEDNLYFIISGTLRDSTYNSIENRGKVYREPNLNLKKDDYFGDIYPFDVDKKSNSHVETRSRVELLKISKENLRKICIRYPKIEYGLLKLLKIRSKESIDNSPKKLRHARRIQLKLDLGIQIQLNGSPNTSTYLSGYSSDVSIGGLSFILDETGLNSFSKISSSDKDVKRAKVQVNLPIEELKVSIPGKIVWLSTVSHEGRKTTALGIQFEKMTPQLRGMLMMFFNSFHKK
jgi:CRP-like cAMP-binding protein